MIVAPGATSVSVDIFFADDTGAAVTGKVASDFPAVKWSGGSNTADTTITLSDLAAITTAHPNDNTAGGVKEREGGWYRLDLPNNMLTSAGRKTLTFAESSGKRIIAPFIDCQYVQGDVRQLLGTAWLAPAVAGTPDVNSKQIGGLAQSSGDIFPAVTNIAVTSAALNTTSGSRTITTGSGAGGVANTTAADSVYDSLSDSAGTLDFYYQFDISGTSNSVGVGSSWLGYVVGVVNTIKVYAYNWSGASWDQIGTIVGIAGTSNMSDEWELTSAHTGTGGNLGLVRIRFSATGLVSATVKTDRILLGYAITPGDATLANQTTLLTRIPGTVQPQTGDSYARLGAPVNASISADIAEIEVETDDIAAIKAKTDLIPAAPASTTNITAGTITTVTNLTNAPTAGDLTATMKTSVQTAADAAVTANALVLEIEADTDTLTAGVTVTTNNDKTGYALTSGERNSVADALLDRTDGVETGITPRQAYRLFMAVLAGKAAESAGTVLFKRADGTTTAITVVHDTAGSRTVVTIGNLS